MMNYYEILEVSPQATQDEIHKSYIRLARKYHPDMNPGNSEILKKMQEINNAYEVLGNAESRREYDEKLGYESSKEKYAKKSGEKGKQEEEDRTQAQDIWEEINKYYTESTANEKAENKKTKKTLYSNKEILMICVVVVIVVLFAQFQKKIHTSEETGESNETFEETSEVNEERTTENDVEAKSEIVLDDCLATDPNIVCDNIQKKYGIQFEKEYGIEDVYCADVNRNMYIGSGKADGIDMIMAVSSGETPIIYGGASIGMKKEDFFKALEKNLKMELVGTDQSVNYYLYSDGEMGVIVQVDESNYVYGYIILCGAYVKDAINGKQNLTDVDSEITADAGNNEQSMPDFIFPQSSEMYLTEYDLQNLTKDQCRIARNEIYARHGRMFSDATLQSYFNQFSWYNGTIEPDQFDDAILNDYEKQNLQLISDYEQNLEDSVENRIALEKYVTNGLTAEELAQKLEDVGVTFVNDGTDIFRTNDGAFSMSNTDIGGVQINLSATGTGNFSIFGINTNMSLEEADQVLKSEGAVDATLPDDTVAWRYTVDGKYSLIMYGTGDENKIDITFDAFLDIY